MSQASLQILTGTFGSGKTTILETIGGGIHCIGEPAREIIAAHRSMNGPDSDPSPPEFVAALLQRSIRNHELAQRLDEPVIFDRGVPDCTAYARHMGLDPMPATRASWRYRYNLEVLLLEPWEEIYTTDDMRTAPFELALAFHRALVNAYGQAGYTLVPVPRGPVEDRAAFVRDFVGP